MRDDFLVIKYRIRAKVKALGDGAAWGLVTAKPSTKKVLSTEGKTYTASITGLTKEKALSIIEENGLEIAHRDADGTIWDSGDFRNKYRGNIYIPEMR